MTDWAYPGDEVVRLAFVHNILKIIKEKGLTIEQFEQRLAEAQKGLNAGVHERAFGRAIKRLREERKMTRKALAASAGIPVRILIQVERGHGGRLVSVPGVCRIAAALKLRPHELMAHYQLAVEQADRAQAWWRP